MSSLDLIIGDRIYTNTVVNVTVSRGFIANKTIAVAIKEQVHTSLLEANAAIKEAMTQVSLSHPSICKVYECFLQPLEDREIKSVIVIELMKKDLATEIEERKDRNEPWTDQQLLVHLRSLVSALFAAQKMGISHRDIKPQNIFVTDTTLKLGDFGSSARVFRSSSMSQTIQGSPFFLSPELKKRYALSLSGSDDNQPYDSFKSDVYSLGLTFLYMAMLEAPLQMMKLTNLSQITELTLSTMQNYPFLQWILRDMLKVDPLQRAGIEELEQQLSQLPGEVAQLQIYEVSDRKQGISIVYIALKNPSIRPISKLPPSKRCKTCGSTDFHQNWSRRTNISLSESELLCSLACFQLSKCIDPNCVRCESVAAESELVLLPCFHCFHNRDCFATFCKMLQCNLASDAQFQCPSCHEEISKKFIEQIFGLEEFEQMTHLDNQSLCNKCRNEPAVYYCQRCKHQCCQLCQFTFFWKKVCPYCSPLKKIVSLGAAKSIKQT